ncbi:unnamed protein product [Linum tenue]|uniref:Cytochrome P450 n=1 Tax=Linum tenue TaxID=586396 RepID=A0AAV0INJ2_9ROSI|nr:unnamed protein product [Linum tenue]
MVGPQQPHRRLMDLAKKHGPIMHLQLGETSNVIVSSPELASEFRKTHDLNFASRPMFPIAGILSYGGRNVSFAPYGEYWRHVRKVCTLGLLNAKRVAFFRPVMQDEMAKLVTSIQMQQQVAVVLNISRMLMSVGITIISRAAFGKLAAEDLVDVLLKYRENPELGFPFTNVEIKAVIMDMILGGGEITATTVSWAMSELMRHPHILEKANKEVRQVFDGKGIVDEAGFAELNYLKSILRETLVPLECQERVVIAGYGIPEKTRVYINVLAIGQDSRHWAEPQEFCPERFLDRPEASDYKGTCFEFIPFGAGRRMCPGILFGMTFAEIMLANLLYHFDWELPNGIKPQDLDMSERFGITVTRKNDLHLIPIRCHPKTV